VHAEMVELFTRARDVTLSYVIHFASGQVTADAPATRTGLQDWFSRMLSATKQGVDDAVAEPLCRVRRTHELMVIKAAYTTYGFSLPDCARPTGSAFSRSWEGRRGQRFAQSADALRLGVVANRAPSGSTKGLCGGAWQRGRRARQGAQDKRRVGGYGRC